MNVKAGMSRKRTRNTAYLPAALILIVLLSGTATAEHRTDQALHQSSGCTGHTSAAIARKEALYHSSIINYSSQYGINPNLVKAVISVESCFNHKAVSAAGAQGLMQLMPETAKWLGVSDSIDSEQNLEAGIRYLSKLKKRYNNDNKLALAAYNAGPGNVRKYKGIPPFPETQSYVVKVEARFKLYQMQDQVALNVQ